MGFVEVDVRPTPDPRAIQWFYTPQHRLVEVIGNADGHITFQLSDSQSRIRYTSDIPFTRPWRVLGWVEGTAAQTVSLANQPLDRSERHLSYNLTLRQRTGTSTTTIPLRVIFENSPDKDVEHIELLWHNDHLTITDQRAGRYMSGRRYLLLSCGIATIQWNFNDILTVVHPTNGSIQHQLTDWEYPAIKVSEFGALIEEEGCRVSVVRWNQMAIVDFEESISSALDDRYVLVVEDYDYVSVYDLVTGQRVGQMVGNGAPLAYDSERRIIYHESGRNNTAVMAYFLDHPELGSVPAEIGPRNTLATVGKVPGLTGSGQVLMIVFKPKLLSSSTSRSVAVMPE